MKLQNPSALFGVSLREQRTSFSLAQLYRSCTERRKFAVAGRHSGGCHLAPPAGHAAERLIAHLRRFRSQEYEEAATLAMLSPLSREPSVGMFFVKAATHQVCQLRVSREIISIQSVQGRSEVSISSAFSAFFAAASSAFASTSGSNW
jgi:hypothetical protein